MVSFDFQSGQNFAQHYDEATLQMRTLKDEDSELRQLVSLDAKTQAVLCLFFFKQATHFVGSYTVDPSPMVAVKGVCVDKVERVLFSILLMKESLSLHKWFICPLPTSDLRNNWFNVMINCLLCFMHRGKRRRRTQRRG